MKKMYLKVTFMIFLVKASKYLYNEPRSDLFMEDLKVFHCYDSDVCCKLLKELETKGVHATKVNNDIVTNKENYLEVLSVGQSIVKDGYLSLSTSVYDIYGNPAILNFLKVMKCTTNSSVKTSYTWELLNDDTVVPKEVLVYAKELENALKRKVCFKFNNLDGSIDVFVKGVVKDQKTIITDYMNFQKNNRFVWDKVYFYDEYGVLETKNYTEKERVDNMLSYFERTFATEYFLLTEVMRNKIGKPTPNIYRHLIQYEQISENEKTLKVLGKYLSITDNKEIPFVSVIKECDGIVFVKTKIKDNGKEFNDSFVCKDQMLVHTSDDGTENFLVPKDFTTNDDIRKLRINIPSRPNYLNNYTLTRKK